MCFFLYDLEDTFVRVCTQVFHPILFLGDIMAYTSDLLAELNILTLYDLSETQQGIKVHHTADPEAIAATKRLCEKGLVTQKDGGYLTGLGMDAAEYAQGLLTILTTA